MGGGPRRACVARPPSSRRRPTSARPLRQVPHSAAPDGAGGGTCAGVTRVTARPAPPQAAHLMSRRAGARARGLPGCPARRTRMSGTRASNDRPPGAGGVKRGRLQQEAAATGSRVTVVLGAQWGDEGKGKVVDLLATDADIVSRCQVRAGRRVPHRPASPFPFPGPSAPERPSQEHPPGGASPTIPHTQATHTPLPHLTRCPLPRQCQGQSYKYKSLSWGYPILMGGWGVPRE